MRPTYINGRILMREHGGIRRFATEVVERMSSPVVVRPRAAKRRWSGRVWEQTTLLQRTANGVLLNMAHSGPARHPRQVNVIHDLLVLDDPTSVHPAYAALMRMQIPRLVTNATRLVTVSTSVADQIAKRFDVTRADITVVPPGISDIFGSGDRRTACAALGLEPGRPVVAALLDPTPRKNSVATVELLRRVQRDRPAVQIVVAGRTKAPDFGRRRRAALPASRTGFLDLGPADDPTLAAMYRAADVFVSLTLGEGFGLPAVEAAVSGAAVVTTPIPSVTDHGPGAAVVVDSATATDAVLDLLDDPERRAELTRVAAACFADLRWGRTAASLEVIMNDVAQT